jgi:carboxypeptidase Taq
VTYNLHVMVRFDLELQLLEGRLGVKDLPEAWRAAMRAHLEVAPDDDRDGRLQDVHWYSGYIGGRFQSYAIGNILSAQFYAAALQAHPISHAKSPVANSARCIPGCGIMFTSTEVNSPRTTSSSA